MKWLNTILNRRSAYTAKDRLKIVIAQERSANDQPDFLPLLHKEIMAVIEKYMRVSSDMVKVDFKHQEKSAVLMLNVVLPSVEKIKN